MVLLPNGFHDDICIKHVHQSFISGNELLCSGRPSAMKSSVKLSSLWRKLLIALLLGGSVIVSPIRLIMISSSAGSLYSGGIRIAWLRPVINVRVVVIISPPAMSVYRDRYRVKQKKPSPDWKTASKMMEEKVTAPVLTENSSALQILG